MLPIRDPDAPRTANLITNPNHEVWGATTADALYEMFELAFPQIPWRVVLPAEEAQVTSSRTLTMRCLIGLATKRMLGSLSSGPLSCT
jgi:hypothetical protein